MSSLVLVTGRRLHALGWAEAVGGVVLGPSFLDLWADRHRELGEGKVRMTTEIVVSGGCEDKVYI